LVTNGRDSERFLCYGSVAYVRIRKQKHGRENREPGESQTHSREFERGCQRSEVFATGSATNAGGTDGPLRKRSQGKRLGPPALLGGNDSTGTHKTIGRGGMNVTPQSPDSISGPQQPWLAEFQLADGRRLYFRHVVPEDEPLMAAAISTASRQTLLHRFFSPIRKVSPEMLRRMLAIDRSKETCIVGFLVDGAPKLVCGARYVRLKQPGMAELALTVHDDFQRHGLGEFLLKLLMRMGQAEGIRFFEAYVMNSNGPMLKLFQKVAPKHSRSHYEGDVSRIVIDLESTGLDRTASQAGHDAAASP
jgi:ribosomal protein S18 acetylase RimI-like enzyme